MPQPGLQHRQSRCRAVPSPCSCRSRGPFLQTHGRPSTPPSLLATTDVPLCHCKCAVQTESLSVFPLGLLPTEHRFLANHLGCCEHLSFLLLAAESCPTTGTHRTSTVHPLRDLWAVSSSGPLRINPVTFGCRVHVELSLRFSACLTRSAMAGPRGGSHFVLCFLRNC